jgi:NAD-dependent SIR2 family protein deacetylase
MLNYEDLVMSAQFNYSRFYPIYAAGKTVVKLSQKKMGSYNEQIREFAQRVKEADCILVGGASGLSAAGGGDFYYGDSPSFRKYFGKFANKYHFKGAFAGMKYPFKTRGERWGYVATFLHTTQHASVRQPYVDLAKILEGRDYFILTTNQDIQFLRLFPEEKVAEIQGDHRFFQCASCCSDDTWDAVTPVQDMIDAMGDGTKVPEALIPKCPHCGGEVFPWVRGYGNFLEGTKYHKEYEKVSYYVDANRGRKILYIELGVGRMTPMFIQEPFWNLTFSNPDAFYISVNAEHDFLPEAIENQGFVIKNDIGKVLQDVAVELTKESGKEISHAASSVE